MINNLIMTLADIYLIQKTIFSVIQMEWFLPGRVLKIEELDSVINTDLNVSE